MYSNVNILLTILAYQCLTVCRAAFDFDPFDLGLSSENDTGTWHALRPASRSTTPSIPLDSLDAVPGIVQENCKLEVPYEDYNMPVPITSEKIPKVIYPDTNRILNIRRFDYFRLLCSETKFAYPIKANSSDILVKCLGKNLIEYDTKIFDWHKFRCNETPKPVSVSTKKKCLSKYSIVKIGFRGNNTFQIRYKVCMDLWSKNTLFAWYVVETPHHYMRQVSFNRPQFIMSPVFGEVDIPAMYRRQTSTIEKILRSRLVARKFIRKHDGMHFLTPGHLLARNEFNYIFEQDSTFFYENTAPQWQVFADGIWRDVERLFRRNLAKAASSTHVIMAGTYGSCTLPDMHNQQQPLLLFLPSSLTVPLFIWKLDYDLITESGVVYIALNDPYRNISKSVYICDTIKCPGKLVRKSKAKAVLYCCTKDAFERVYGRFEEHLFNPTL